MSGVQRFTAEAPCDVCSGYDRQPRGHGVRCHGFRSRDGRYCHCSREEYAGGLPLEPDSGTYAHLISAPCRCGATHGTPPATAPQNGHARHAVRNASHVLRAADGAPVAVHRRTYYSDGSKTVWWERPDGTRGLGGTRAAALPLYGVHELNGAEQVVVTEGEPARDALHAFGIPSIATVCGAAAVPGDEIGRAS